MSPGGYVALGVVIILTIGIFLYRLFRYGNTPDPSEELRKIGKKESR